MSTLEKEFLKLPWEQVRESVEVKLLDQAGGLYIQSRSAARGAQGTLDASAAIERLVKRLCEIQQQKLSRDELLIKLGAATPVVDSS